jgi:hypothetical protein
MASSRDPELDTGDMGDTSHVCQSQWTQLLSLRTLDSASPNLRGHKRRQCMSSQQVGPGLPEAWTQVLKGTDNVDGSLTVHNYGAQYNISTHVYNENDQIK